MSTPVEREMPQRMLNAAVSFYQAGARCALPFVVSPTQEYSLGAPTIVNYAFAIELYLKLLHLLTSNVQAKREHDLFKLYDLLDTATKRKITERCRSAYGDDGYVVENLQDAAKVFIEWRYAHEHEFLVTSPDTLEALATALHLTVKDVAPATLRVPE